MLFQRFESEGLAHYSYAVGCPGSRQLAIVDPRRDVDAYLDFAEAGKARISHVFETHIHADYASGARELAERTGAVVHVSGYDRGERYEVSFPHRDLSHGERIAVGDVQLEVVHTPGHTPEHVSFLVYDLPASPDVPRLMLTGDFLFVGSMGRPDLLGEDEKRTLAARLFESRARLAGLPDELEIYPGHGAGSMCGSGMSARPDTTLRAERMVNPFLDPALDRDAFMVRILGTLPPFPPYYRLMKERNAAGPPALDGLPGRAGIPAEHCRELLDRGHVLVDLRDHVSYGRGHIPGAFGIGADARLPQWAAWAVPYDTPIVLLSPRAGYPEHSVRALVRVGLDRVVGYLDGGMDAWTGAGYPVARTELITSRELAARLHDDSSLTVLDVRTDGEFAAGHVPGARHVFGGTIAEHLDELPRQETTLVLICGSGYRSSVTASVLQRAGFTNVANVMDGMGGWVRAGLPTTPEA